MVRNNFMMHLCTFATLCFFKITFPRNYYYCNQDDTIPWVCVLKYVSNSNCCHRHLKLYISMFKSFHTYRKYIYQQSYYQVWSVIIIIMIILLVIIANSNEVESSWWPRAKIGGNFTRIAQNLQNGTEPLQHFFISSWNYLTLIMNYASSLQS